MHDDPYCAKRSPHALIVEDEPVFRSVLEQAFDRLDADWTLSVFEFGSEAVAHVDAASRDFDIALVDLGLPDVCGLAVIRELRRRRPKTPIMVVSIVASEEKVLQTLQAGASGYILKDDDAIDIAIAVREALLGNLPISPALARCLLRHLPCPAPFAAQDVSEDDAGLTPREDALLRHIARGASYADAACAMGLQLSTIHSYSRNLFRKLGARSKTQAVAAARRKGMMV